MPQVGTLFIYVAMALLAHSGYSAIHCESHGRTGSDLRVLSACRIETADPQNKRRVLRVVAIYPQCTTPYKD